jgi:septum formation protein
VLVIGADTLVVCRGETIGKPTDRKDAVRILMKLSRNPHTVVTALHLIAPDGRDRCSCTEASLGMRPMTRRDIEEYLAGTDALDKAGAYALTPGDRHVERVEGSMTCVMGLPIEELTGMLESLYPGCTGAV